MTSSEASMDGSEPAARSDQFVMVPVRVELVDDVIAFIAERTASIALLAMEAGEAPRGSYATRIEEPGGLWTLDQWRSLYEAGTVTSKRIDRILQALASAGAGEVNRLSLSELARRSDMTPSEVRSALSKLTQHMKVRPAVYPADVAWPFGWTYGREIDPENPREFHYFFSVEQHQSWARAQGQKQQD